MNPQSETTYSSPLHRPNEDMFESIHRELASLASFLLNRHEQHVSLFTHDLVGEAIARLLGANALKVNDKSHLKALAARAMRRVLIDAARQRAAQKRDYPVVTLRTQDVNAEISDVELVKLDIALSDLKTIDPMRAHIVELRYFGGLSLQEIATVTDTSVSTVQRAWRSAKTWLKLELTQN